MLHPKSQITSPIAFSPELTHSVYAVSTCAATNNIIHLVTPAVPLDGEREDGLSRGQDEEIPAAEETHRHAESGEGAIGTTTELRT